MREFIVRADNKGRGHARPFGSYKKSQAGAMVEIGDKKYKVSTDGRVNIPKKIMNNFGVKGKDGRMRIAIDFSSKAGKKGWKKVAAGIVKPGQASKNLKTNDPALFDKYTMKGQPKLEETEEYLPESDEDYNWT